MASRGKPAFERFSAKDGMATLSLSFNWDSMALGSPESWPQDLRSALGKPQSIGLAADISERKRTQKELQRKSRGA